MLFDETYLRQLIERQTESLSVEIKRWIDPSTPEGIAKIVKSSIALRNNNGGFLIIGFDNNTHLPDTNNTPRDVRKTFDADTIQYLVSKHSSSPFEVIVTFINKNGQDYPVLCVGSGIKTPIVTKAGLNDSTGKTLIKVNCIYVRTTSSNNTPSTSEIRYQDWARLLELCFDNREADIGRFIRRHLDNLNAERVTELVSAFQLITSPGQNSNESKIDTYIQECDQRFHALVTGRKLSLPEHGAWEATFIIDGSINEFSANTEFLNLIGSSNPDYTGWPLWVDSRAFTDRESHPHVYKGAWEALLVFLKQGVQSNLDFWRIHPKGLFYHRRALEDDIPLTGRHPVPLTVLDFGLPIWRVGEAMALGLAFAKAMGSLETNTNLKFQFRWTRLLNRQLTSWAEPGRRSFSPRKSYQDEVISSVSLPLETPLSSLPQFVHKALKPLYEVFEGFEAGLPIVEEFVVKMLHRRW